MEGREEGTTTTSFRGGKCHVKNSFLSPMSTQLLYSRPWLHFLIMKPGISQDSGMIISTMAVKQAKLLTSPPTHKCPFKLLGSIETGRSLRYSGIHEGTSAVDRLVFHWLRSSFRRKQETLYTALFEAQDASEVRCQQ